MKNLLNPKRNLLTGALLAVVLAPLHALETAEWQYRQSLTLEKAAPTRLTLSPAMLDLGQPDGRDLRVLGADGSEVPYVVLKPAQTQRTTRDAGDFRVSLQGEDTIVTFSTGSTQPLDEIRLRSPGTTFLAPAKIELSADGQHWETLISGAPFFRQDGAEQTSFSLEKKRAAQIRITLSRARYGAIVVTGAEVIEAGRSPERRELTGVTFSREEFAGESVFTVDLGAANQPLLGVEFAVDSEIFNRRVTASIRTWSEAGIEEAVLSTGSIFRVRHEGLSDGVTTERLWLPVEGLVPTRELILRVENGDSAPLALKAVRAFARPVDIVISPTATGRHTLITGNPDARSPRYDLAAFVDEFSRLSRSEVSTEALEINAAYHRADPLGGLTAEGTSIEPSEWSIARQITLKAAGVQQLELDPAVLGATRADYADLRLVRENRQMPYILERTSLQRKISLTPVLEPDAKRPGISRWKLTLPSEHLPVRRLTLHTPAPLFQRQLTVYQNLRDHRGETYRQHLASTTWTRQPGGTATACEIDLSSRIDGDTLWLETDNGDNPAISLSDVSIAYPVVRLLFKTADTATLTLLYGRDNISAPRYDLGLVAGRLLAAEKQIASLSAETAKLKNERGPLFKNASTSAIFWGALAIVVVLLLVIVAKLLPKPEAK